MHHYILVFNRNGVTEHVEVIVASDDAHAASRARLSIDWDDRDHFLYRLNVPAWGAGTPVAL